MGCQKEITAQIIRQRDSHIVTVESRREGREFTTSDTRFHITSASSSAEKLLDATRKHWAIENSLHWTFVT